VRSTHADTFNHDDEADGYDADVADETNPIRAGYAATLTWVVARADVRPDDAVVDLGAGTGNLSVRLPRGSRLTCVDVSSRMLAVAGRKLGDDVEYVQSDLLQWFDRPETYDVIASTYAIHHLTDGEKEALITAAAERLNRGGRLVVGDLMAASRSGVPALRARLNHPDVDELFDVEFAWWVDATVANLDAAGFVGITLQQLSDLSWGVAAVKG
jgi:putative AdoMet-dependent methyltransferase